MVDSLERVESIVMETDEKIVWVKNWVFCVNYGHCQKHSRVCYHCAQRFRCRQRREYEALLPLMVMSVFEKKAGDQKEIVSMSELKEEGVWAEES